MQCPKCGRKVAGKRETCMYCGAFLIDKPSTLQNIHVVNDHNVYISTDEQQEVKLENLPEKLRHKVEEAVRKGDHAGTVIEERSIVRPASGGQLGEHAAISLKKTLRLLSQMQDSFHKGKIEISIYERMATDIVKDYISSLDDSIKVNFVANGITDSELLVYLTDEMLNNIRAFVISSVADK